MVEYERKQGDEVELTETLTKPDSDTAYDLSTADSVKIFMDHPDSETLVVNDTVTFTSDGSDGKVEYTLSSGETARDGFHRIEFVIQYPSSPTQITYPHDGFVILDAEETTDRTLAVADSSDPDANLTTLYADEIAANTAAAVAVKDDLDLESLSSILNAASVETADLGISQSDGTVQDFVASGDVLPLQALTPYTRTKSFTDTAWASDTAFYSYRFQFGDVIPAGASLVARFTCGVFPGTDETVDVRLRNVTDNETLVSETGISGNKEVDTGWTAYTPTTTASNVSIRMQWQESNGLNSSDIRDLVTELGIQL